MATAGQIDATQKRDAGLYTPEFRASVRGALSGGKIQLSDAPVKKEMEIAEFSTTARHKREVSTNRVLFAKPAPIQPDLKQFLDDAVIPILIRQALAEIAIERPPRPPLHSVGGNDSL